MKILLKLVILVAALSSQCSAGPPKKNPKISPWLHENITAAPEAHHNIHICFKSQESFKILRDNFIITTIGTRKEGSDSSPGENSRDYGPSKYEIGEYFRPIVEADSKDVKEYLIWLKGNGSISGDMRLENPALMACWIVEGIAGSAVLEVASKFPKIQMITPVAQIDNSSKICPSLQLLLGRSLSFTYSINICFNKTAQHEQMKADYEASIIASRKPAEKPFHDDFYKPSRWETNQHLKTIIDGTSEGIKKFFAELKYTTAQLVHLKPNDYWEKPCIKGKDVPGDLIRDLPEKFNEIVDIYQL